MSLPDATPNPCDACPWRRNATRGWLGPFPADDWIAIAQSDEPVACHQTISVSGEWAPGTLQCRGLAIFRENICKSPRNPEVITGPVDRERVFARPQEFLDHHDSPLAEWLEEQRADER